MTQTLTMSALYKKLAKIGLKKDYIRENGLPSWWDDELSDKPLAVLEGAGYIADHLNLDLKSLICPEVEVKFNSPPPTKFKHHNTTKKKHPKLAQALASRVAELIAYGTDVKFTPLPTDVKEIRKEILGTHPTVHLISLLEYCWSKGIIVAYFHQFPQGTKKFAGLIQWQDNCPVIILSSKHQHAARFTFDLAHELGHLALGHLEQGVLIDEKIEFNCYDEEECQADQFANYLLLENYDNLLGKKKFKDAKTFSQYVIEYFPLSLLNLEADAIILNYGWHNKNYFPLAIAALNELGSLTNGQNIINEYLANRLNWDKFSDEAYDYLEKVLGV